MRRISYAVILVLLMSWGCHRKSSSVTVPVATPTAAPAPEAAPPAVTPRLPATRPAPLAPAPIAKTIMYPSSLDLGEMSFLIGKYPQAARSFEEYLSASQNSEKRDMALFYLGMSKAMAGDSGRDMRQAEAAFKRLITEFPNSRYRGQAEYILGLQQQVEKMRADLREREERIKKLSDELHRLKEIDLQSKPSRPPE